MATQLGSLPLMSIVKVKENGVAQDFYVVRHNAYTSGRTLLLRRYIHSERQWHSSNVNAYATSTLDAWLNGEYFNSLAADIRGQIAAVPIPYTPGNGNTTLSSLSRKVFAVSATELGGSHTHLNAEGTALANAADLKIATDSGGTAKVQWSRSPGANTTTLAWYLFPNGTLGNSGGCTSTYGVRPAFTLPATIGVEDDGAVVGLRDPTISGEDSDLGRQKSNFTIQYSVDDANETDILSVTERVDETVVRTIPNAVRNQNYDMEVDISGLSKGQHTAVITVDDGNGGVAVRTHTFIVGEFGDGRIKNPIITKVKPRAPIYGVAIDTTNSNPETSVTYINDAVGLLPSSGGNGSFVDNGWDSRFPFNQIKPVMLQDGVEVGDLDKNDYSKWADDHSPTPDITSGDGGDVMIKFPYMHYRIETVGNTLYVQYSQEAFAGSTDIAFEYNGIKPAFYIGAYHGWVDSNNKLRSLSGKTPTTNQTIDWFRIRAQNNGAGYEQLNWYKLILLQILYLVRFKNRNSHVALGYGWTNSGVSAPVATGGTNAYGFNYGTSTNGRLKFCGIEDFYGNVLNWVDGLAYIPTKQIGTATSGFNDTGNGYTIVGSNTANVSGYITQVKGDNALGFLITQGGGSATTYWCDSGVSGVSSAAQFAWFGGYWDDRAYAGAFRLSLGNSAASVSSSVGARAVFCG